MKHLMQMLIVVVLLMLVVTPVMAQDTEETVTALPDDAYVIDGSVMDNLFMIAMSMVAAVFMLFGGALYALYHSQPKWGQAGIQMILETVLPKLEELAAKSTTKIDDEAVKEIRIGLEGIVGREADPVPSGG